MLKKNVSYTDYNGVDRTEDHYFNLNEAEIMELELSVSGGLTETINRIIAAQDTPALVKLFKKLVLMSYGVKSPDGKRFIKSEELTKEFEQTEAYSKIFMELATNDVAAANFVNGIVPKNIADEAKKAGVTAIPQKTE